MLKKIIGAALVLCAFSSPACAQTNPNLRQGQVLTPAQWNALFASKQDTLGFTPMNTAGGVFTGRVVTAPPGASQAGFNLTPGTAPGSPANGDLWVTTSGIFARVNGATYNLLSVPASSIVVGTTAITGGVANGLIFNNGGMVGNLATANNGVLVTNGSGVPSISSTLPSGLTAPSFTVTTAFTATGLVGLSNLANQAANTVLANATGSAAAPTAFAMPPCTGSANALQWGAGSGFACAAITSAAGSVAIGTTTVTSGVNTHILYNNAGVLGEYTLTGTGTVVAMQASPSFTGSVTLTTSGANGFVAGPNGATNPSFNVDASTASAVTGLNVKSAASGGGLALSVISSATNEPWTLNAKGSGLISIGNLSTGGLALAGGGGGVAIGGCTIGANSLCTSGSASFASIFSAAHIITSTSPNALTAGQNGTTNPAFNLDISTASSATGLNVKSAAAGGGLAVSVISSGTNEALTIDARGSGTITLAGTSTGGIALSRTTTITSSAASALAVGPSGATNPVLQVDASTASQATGLKITGAATGGSTALAVIDSGSNAGMTIDAKGTGSITIGGTSTGSISLGRTTTVTSSASSAFAVGPNGATNPGLLVDASTASSATGLSVKSAAAGGGVALAVISSGTNESATFNAKGSGTINIGGVSTGAVTIGGGGGGLTVSSSFTATGLVGYAALASGALATSTEYYSAAASKLVSASVIYPSETTTTFGATTTFDFDTFINTAVTLTGNITTQTLSNVRAGKAGMIVFIQDGTGSRTTVWNSIFKFAGGVSPTLSTTANSVDILFYSCRSATNCPASLSKAF